MRDYDQGGFMKNIIGFMFLVSTAAFGNDIIMGHGTGLLYNKDAPKFGRTYSTFADCDNLPAEFDLRDLNVVPPVKNQGSCGSCWSFSKTASLESAEALSNGKLSDLSEQELVSCDKQQYGCQGGFLSDFDYQIKNGQGLETDFPYTASDSRCKKIPVKVKGTKFQYVGTAGSSPTEKEVMCAMFHGKTIPWTVVAANNAWSNASSADDGVMSSCGARGINHAIGLVGWKTINNKVYFKLRNSWGNQWGSTAGRPASEKGYALSPHRCNLLNDEVAYIITDKTCKPPIINAPALVTVDKNTDTPIILPEADLGTEYVWFDGDHRIAKGSTIILNEDRPAIYKVVATNSCGRSETLVKIEVNL